MDICHDQYLWYFILKWKINTDWPISISNLIFEYLIFYRFTWIFTMINIFDIWFSNKKLTQTDHDQYQILYFILQLKTTTDWLVDHDMASYFYLDIWYFIVQYQINTDWPISVSNIIFEYLIFYKFTWIFTMINIFDIWFWNKN